MRDHRPRRHKGADRPLDGVGRDYPLSIEKLCPVLSFYVVKDWREGCERCKQILRYGGMGHTMSIHSQNEQVILEFGLKKPAFRIVVNTPTTLGSIGLTTGLDPAMTLGCGGYGGNITSDNISPRHLLNIKRLAYEIAPVANRFEATGASAGGSAATASRSARPARPAAGITAEALTHRIDDFLGSRGFRGDSGGRRPAPKGVPGTDAGSARTTRGLNRLSATPLDSSVRKTSGWPSRRAARSCSPSAPSSPRRLAISARLIASSRSRPGAADGARKSSHGRHYRN